MQARRTLILFVFGLLLSGHSFSQVIKDTKGDYETYTSLLDSPFLKTGSSPATRFAVNANRAAYSNIRRFLNMSVKVPYAAVRIEEMYNYFNINYTSPGNDSLVNIRSYRTTCPWSDDKQLLFYQINTASLNLTDIPPSNLVFLIDVSGSMDLPNRLPLLQSSFRKLVKYLRPIDTISIVIYGGATGIYLTPTGGDEKEKIHKAIDDLSAGGTTPGEAGLIQAYNLARSTFIEGGNNRIILATDGDFNVGQKDEEELGLMISKMKNNGIYLTCLGVGMGNYKDSKIEILARKGNGNFAYLDSENEGEKVLITEFTQNMYAACNNVYMDVQFDTSTVTGYRLIGYNNIKKTLKETSSTSTEGGEIGYDQSIMAVFEVSTRTNDASSLAEVKLHYTPSSTGRSASIIYQSKDPIIPFDKAMQPYRFTTSLTMFGLLLRQTEKFPHSKWDELIQLSNRSVDIANPLQKEYVDLLHKAQKIYVSNKRNKSKRF